jgi:serine/threonine-protein kinase
MHPDSPAESAARDVRRISTIDASRMHEVARARSPWLAKRYLAWGAGVLLLGILGSWTHHAIEQSLRQLRADSLSSMLDAQAQAVDVWVEEKQLAARRLARDARLRAAVSAVVQRRDGTCLSLADAGLGEILEPFRQDETLAAFHVFAPDGRLVAAQPAAACRAEIPAPLRARVRLALNGADAFAAPARDESGLANPRARDRPAAVIWFLTPVLDPAGHPIAAIALGKYADARFSGILAAARTGRSGEVFAFDERAVLLSESRFAADLAARGQIPASDHPSALLNVALRTWPSGADEQAPLTRLAEEALSPAAIASRRGTLLEPYESYRGARVVGAWRWLPERGLVLAVEIEADEAYAPLLFLNAAFGLMFGALVAATTGALLYALWVRRQVGRAFRLGAYVLEHKIGEGGMANVYLARHALLRRPTAVKILRPERSSEQFIARFEREVKLASQLTHPNTVEIYDYGRTPEGLFYYAMEYLEGVEMLELVKAGAMPVARAIYLLRQVCAGLAEAHAKGLVHRDIKPENIMICTHGGEFDVVKILDFGLVKNVAEPHTRDLTRTIKFLGTPLYMAPERFRSPSDVDARADIYSVGVVAFSLLTGREVFEGADDLELSNRVLNDPAPRRLPAARSRFPSSSTCWSPRAWRSGARTGRSASPTSWRHSTRSR